MVRNEVTVALAEPALLEAWAGVQRPSEAPTLPDLPWYQGPGRAYVEAYAAVQPLWLEYRAAYLLGYPYHMYHLIAPLVAACERLGEGVIAAARLSPGSPRTRLSIEQTRYLNDEIFMLISMGLREASPAWGMMHILAKIEDAGTMIASVLSCSAIYAEDLIRATRRYE